jgi:CMP-N,N'-diacetyllegionaminic acid synthase
MPTRRNPDGETLAIIPARGGSKGVARKNLRDLAGKPLLLHSIEHAQATSEIDDIIVSTDDPEIASVAAAAGVQVVQRPAELARDETPTLPVLLHVLQQLAPGRAPSRVLTLQPTSPLRFSKDLSAAIALLTPPYDSVVGVCVAEHSPYKMFNIRDDELLPLIPDVRPGTPRQKLPLAYRENGALYVTWSDVLIDQASIWGTRTKPYLMEPESSVDIDNLLDFVIAEAILKSRSVKACIYGD